MIDKELLDILACPACKGDIELKDKKIVCKKCKKKYPVRDGIPIMIIEEADPALPKMAEDGNTKGRAG